MKKQYRYLEGGDPIVAEEPEASWGASTPWGMGTPEAAATPPPGGLGAVDWGPQGPPPDMADTDVIAPPPAAAEPVGLPPDLGTDQGAGGLLTSPMQTMAGDAAFSVAGTNTPAQNQLSADLSAIDAQKAALGGMPVMQPTKWWERVAAGALGGAAGWSNAASRTRNPIDVSAATQGILHPGYQGKLAEWQSRVAPLEMAAKLEAEKQNAYLKAEQIGSQAEQRRALGQRAAALADPHYNQTQLNPDWVKANMPGHAPDKNGEYWVDKSQAVEMEKEAFANKSKYTNLGTNGYVDPSGVVHPGQAKTPTTFAQAELQQFMKENPNATSEALADFANKSKSKAEQENVNHWIAVAADPKSPPEAVADAQKKLAMLRQNQAQTRISITQAQANTPAAQIAPGSREDKIARQLAFGDLSYQQFLGLYSRSTDMNKRADILNRAVDINGNFKPAEYAMGYGFAKSPKVMSQMASLHNVDSGVNDLLKFSDLASRSGATILNKAVIPGGIAVGGTNYTNFHTARVAFADELSGALGYGNATDMAKQMGLDMTDEHLSPENFRSAMTDVVIPFIDRKRKSLLGEMGPYGLEASGNNQAPATTAAAPAAAAGAGQKTPPPPPPFPLKLSQSDVGKTYLSKTGQPIKITAVSPDGQGFHSIPAGKQ